MNIMILGTMSNVGKSYICAGLLRTFMNDGFSVAPFKSQNMALNSYITEDGLEMGMAQAMQAMACNIKPNVNMNPILLKPHSDTGSQVIVNGKVHKTMSAKEYFEYKAKLVPVIQKAYKKLDDKYDIVVIEGAGSPAEINLKQNDIVNMGIAKMFNSPAVLVGDIDRGGVFASLYGTIQLLERDEQRYIKGLIINKFRGDKNLLIPGLNIFNKKINIPFCGIIPQKSLNLPDEDSLSNKLIVNKKATTKEFLDVAIIKFNHISNFTDFDSLYRYDNISIRYITSKEEFNSPDLCIIPGSKNTVKDLQIIKDNGLFDSIIEYRNNGGYIFGICAGLQILGKNICEEELSFKALSFFDMTTKMTDNKKTKQVTVTLSEKFKKIFNITTKCRGYEIHMGQTNMNKTYDTMFDTDEKDVISIVSDDMKIFATYIHSILDNKDFREAFLTYISEKNNKKLLFNTNIDDKKYLDKEFDKLAELISDNLDMDMIYKIVSKGI